MHIFNKEKLDELFNNYHAKMAEVHEEIIDDNHLLGDTHDEMFGPAIDELIANEAKSVVAFRDLVFTKAGNFTPTIARCAFVIGWLQGIREVTSCSKPRVEQP